MGQGLFTKVAQVVAAGARHRPRRTCASPATDTSKVAEHVGHRGLDGQRPQRQGGAGRGAARSGSGSRAFAAEHFTAARRRTSRFAAQRGARSAARAIAIRGARAAGVLARVSLWPTASTRRRRSHWDREDDERPAVLLLRLRRRGVGSRRRHADRRVPAAARRHPARRRATRINPAIDIGQVEGGFIQGMGWLTTEELWWNERGRADDARAVDLQDPGRPTTARPTSA